MKRIRVIYQSKPETPGFNDRFEITDGETLLDSGVISQGPNWMFPSDGSKWQDHYGHVASGLTLVAQCVSNKDYGKCILINGDYKGCAPILSDNPNPNHDGKLIVTEVFWHHSFPSPAFKDWRGSMACMTSPQDVIDKAMENFNDGEYVLFTTETGTP